ncbi:MAG: hypothetical protein ACUZ77_07350 [Candidatus Brocadiales bacterium]
MMKYLSGVFIMGVLTFSVFGQLYAQPLESRINKLEKELQELKALSKEQTRKDLEREADIKKLTERTEKQQKRLEEAARMVEAPSDFYWAKGAQRFKEKGLAPWFGDQRTKPFLSRMGRNTFIGGYMDMEFHAFEEGGKNNSFRQHRLIPFIYSDISDRVKFATEIEFEDGGPQNNRGDGELKIEFATIDFLIREEINLRAGIILSPLGKFNLVHDSPLQDLTDRPMVNRAIIPTTLSESGFGLFGTFYPSELSKLTYEIYAVNGFELLEDDGTSRFSTSSGIRGGRGSQKSDLNRDPAIVGRLAYSPFLGLEFAGSFHTGHYDEGNDNMLTIAAFDMAYQRGPFEVVGEFANAFIEQDSFARENGVPDDMWGYYIEPRYHFMPQCLQKMAPTIFTDDSTFTAVARWGQVDIDGFSRNRATFGLNWRYTEDSVFKLEYQINTEHGRLAERDGAGIANNALVFSIATYF